MKIIVVQLARLGDILQTLPTMQGLRQKYPNAELTLVVREKFAQATRMSNVIDRIIEMPTEQLLAPVVSGLSDQTKIDSLHRLANWVQEISIHGPYDLLINLTFSDTSSWLSSLIQANEKRGVYRANDGAYQIDDSWSQYFFAEVMQKNINIIHLNDLFMKIAGVEGMGFPYQSPQFKNEIQKKNNKKRIGIQATASRSEKTPSALTWGKILKAISKTVECEFVIFGSKKDLDFISSIQKTDFIQADILNLAGNLDFEENYNWVKSCDFIVTPDTAMVHMASLAASEMPKNSLQIINIPMGGVRPEETGPYGDGHHVLYPSDASPDEYAQAIADIIQCGSSKQKIPHSKTKLHIKMNKSKINLLSPYNFDNDECVNFFEKSFYLLSEFRCVGELEDIDVPVVGGKGNATKLDELLLCHENLLKIKKAAEIGSYYCVEMTRFLQNEQELKLLMSKLNEVDSVLEQFVGLNRFLKPLIDWWKVIKACVQSDDLTQLIGLTEGTYRVLQQNVDILIQLMETAVKTAHDRAANSPQQNISKESNV